ncbi:MAG TPA: hypothetical protein VMI06_19890 [Terriglobia bacterium]|nr:hypothetical protein [Terriglobia bacterium]
MAKQLIAPTFKSKSEELAWYDQHWGELERQMETAIKAGTAIRGIPVADPALVPITIRISREDLNAARKLASEEGTRYQTYLRALLHQALRKKIARR